MPAPKKTLDYAMARREVAKAADAYVAPAEYTMLSFDAATVLAKHRHHLEFPGLTRVSPRVASALATQAGTLVLDGFTTMPPSTARGLAAHRGTLVLRHVASLSTEALEALAGHRGPVEMPLFRPAIQDDRGQRVILALHGNLRYNHTAIDVFEGVDFTKFRWTRLRP